MNLCKTKKTTSETRTLNQGLWLGDEMMSGIVIPKITVLLTTECLKGMFRLVLIWIFLYIPRKPTQYWSGMVMKTGWNKKKSKKRISVMRDKLFDVHIAQMKVGCSIHCTKARGASFEL